MIDTSTILLATGNSHKASEMKAILAPLLPAVKHVSLKDVGLTSPPDEIERFKTFPANARAKAIWCAERSGLPSIADDSGLCVDALDGRPGVFSARWAGENASDADRRQMLLNELVKAGVLQREQRHARFVCACVIALPGDPKTLCRIGSVSGQILLECEGDGGFGYDPLFWIPHLNATMASISQNTKNQVSHRGRALRALGSLIRRDMQ